MAQNSTYGQFANPLGLARRLIFSGNRDAYWGLALVAARAVISPIDWLLAKTLFRSRLMHISDADCDAGNDADNSEGMSRETHEPSRTSASANAGTPPTQAPLIFVIGGPRCGTTLCHQVLVRHLDVSYFSNLTDLFPRSGVVMSQLLGKFDQKPTSRYTNFYGVSGGLSTPSDGFSIWNRWLGSHRYSAPEKLDVEQVASIKSYFDHWRTLNSKPFLNKNNRNVDCAVALSEIFPHSYFIEVRRDAVEVAASLLRAREAIQGDQNQPWGLHSDRFAGVGTPVEQVCEQIKSIFSQLDGIQEKIGADRYYRINFENFRSNPAAEIRNIMAMIPSVNCRAKVSLETLDSFESSWTNRSGGETAQLASVLHPAMDASSSSD